MVVSLTIPPSIFLADERVFVSLGVLKVAAVLESAGHTVEVLDLSGIENFEEAAAEHALTSHASFFGITVTTPQMPAAAKILAAFRKNTTARICIGGPHPTLIGAAYKREQKLGRAGRATKAMRQLNEMFDSVVCGDGEEAVFEALKGARFVDGDDPKSSLFMTNKMYEETPMPARHLVDLKSYHYTIDGIPSTSALAQIGCPFACSFSLTGDTEIFTDDGPVELRALASGVGKVRSCAHGPSMLEYRVDRHVASPSGRSLATTAVAEGVRPVKRIITEGGLSVKCTDEHRMLVVEGTETVWRAASKIRPGDFLAVRRPERAWPKAYAKLKTVIMPKIPPGGFEAKTHHWMPSHLTEDLAWLCGFVVGDGSLPRDGRPSFHVCVTPDVDRKLHKIVKECFGVRLAVSAATNTRKMKHGWVHSRLARECLVQAIGIDPFDKLKIPKIFWRSPKSVLEAFIRGLMDADGCGEGVHEYLTTVSERLAKDVSYALLMLDRGCPSITYVDRKGKKYGSKYTGTGNCYRVGVFANDRIPTACALYFSKKSWKWFWRTKRQASVIGVRRRTLKESGLTHPLDKDGWYYVRVLTVDECPAELVYDLTVPDGEAFVANWFVSHNCGGRESNMLRRIRTRSTDSILREFRFLYETYGYRGVMMYDDELNVSKSMVELMRGIAALGKELGVEWKLRGFVKAELFTREQAEAMYAAGFRWILTGFESGSPRILENINKKATREDNDRCIALAHAAGLKVKALMSVGHPGESRETIAETKEWLLRNRPADFDVTGITTYAGTPYYDHAVESSPGVWTYTCPKSKDRLHSYEVDYLTTADYYKGQQGEYKSYVFTDFLTAEELVKERDALENDVRATLRIPFNPTAASVRYEHSMGQLGPNILRRSEARIQAPKTRLPVLVGTGSR